MEAVHEKIREWLADFGHVTAHADHTYTVQRGSARTRVAVVPFGANAVVHVFAFTNVGLRGSPELFQHVALNADSFVFGHLGVHAEADGTYTVTMSCRILADALDREELIAAVEWVSRCADDVDNEIQERFGGFLGGDLP
jgi:hypothetical protein